jgi:hypothetical protein
MNAQAPKPITPTEHSLHRFGARLARLIEMHAPAIIIHNEVRLLTRRGEDFARENIEAIRSAQIGVAAVAATTEPPLADFSLLGLLDAIAGLPDATTAMARAGILGDFQKMRETLREAEAAPLVDIPEGEG